MTFAFAVKLEVFEHNFINDFDPNGNWEEIVGRTAPL
jgi:hypothetical protein